MKTTALLPSPAHGRGAGGEGLRPGGPLFSEQKGSGDEGYPWSATLSAAQASATPRFAVSRTADICMKPCGMSG